MNKVTILQGHVLDKLRELPENSVDSCVTDPPYELGFMGKSWDKSGIAYSVDVWKEVYRVLKPGAHLLAFGGSRTYHRLACAIEDAGFEIRDQIMWIYGSGFPKSLDISKAIDKAGIWNDEFDEVRAWLRKKVKAKGLKHREIDRAIGNENSHMASHFLGISQPMLPTWDQWVIIKKLLGVDEDKEMVPKCVGYERAILGYRRVNAGCAFSSNGPTELPITSPATDFAQQWDGWGTALKPSHEPIVVARKPLEGTVVNNVLKHGTGGLNISKCRIEFEDTPSLSGNPLYRKNSGHAHRQGADKNSTNYQLKSTTSEYEVNLAGRWPANVIHDGSEEVLACFPDSKGQQADVRGNEASRTGGAGTNCYGEYGRVAAGKRGDNGSAARFFYCAKVSPGERGKGNNHPTVKPLALMQYLVRLVTPPGGTVLDCFCGSGSTLIAAAKEGFDSIGIDRSSDYCEIAKKRIRGEMGFLISLDTQSDL